MTLLSSFTLNRFWDPQHTNRAVDTVGEAQTKDPRLYLGNCTLNIPKVKLRIVIRTHILVGDKEMYVDLTVTILQCTHA